MEVRNPFVDFEEAKRYNAFRPVYHDLPFEKLRDFFKTANGDSPINGAGIRDVLDVACGTGHSTLALARFFPHVTGCDISPAMLAETRRADQSPLGGSTIAFVESPAEQMPFADGSFDLVNISMGFHWTNQDAFLAEVNRVLRAGGFLSVENYWFVDELNKKFYTEHFPLPRRNPNYPDDTTVGRHGLSLVQEISYSQNLTMILDRFIGFLLTQSNVLMQRGVLPNIGGLLTDAYSPYFSSGERELPFKGLLKLYRKADLRA